MPLGQVPDQITARLDNTTIAVVIVNFADSTTEIQVDPNLTNVSDLINQYRQANCISKNFKYMDVT